MKKDLFLQLRETIEQDLKRTGFSPSSSPPCEEPRIGGPVSSRSAHQLKDLYDEFLAFYEYLTDNIVRCLGFVSVAKARMELKKAEALIAAKKDDSVTNAESRNGFVLTNPAYMAAQQDHIYFKTMLAMHEERRRKISKSMDRIGRELWLRTQDEPSANPGGAGIAKKPLGRSYKPLRENDR